MRCKYEKLLSWLVWLLLGLAGLENGQYLSIFAMYCTDIEWWEAGVECVQTALL
jgi:hypothetical protein